MKSLESIIEDSDGNVVGAVTSEGRIMLPPENRFPRALLAARARALAQAHGITIPAGLLAVLPPPPEGVSPK